MSWGLDIVTIDVDGNEHWIEVVDSHTYNLTAMWAKAIRFLDVTRDFEGQVCADILGDLKAGLLDIVEHMDDYRKLEPDNGWGDFDGFFAAYVKLIELAVKYPSGVLRWNG